MQKKQCLACHRTYTVYPKDLLYFQKIGVTVPDLCFRCNQIKLLAWRNERFFYLRKCDQCGKKIVSCYNEHAAHPVFCNDCWWSDNFNALQYGRDFNFNRTFFEQFGDLLKDTPVGNLINAKAVNSEYTNLSVSNNNCYMLVASDYNENCSYCSYTSYNKDSLDCTETKNCELCYDSVDLEKCYQCRWSQNLHSCNHCNFCRDCRGCTDCLGCANLRNQNNCLFNKKYTKDDYVKKVAKYQLNTQSGLQKFQNEFNKFKEKQFFLFSQNLNCEQVSGDYLTNCQNCQNCFSMLDCTNCTNCLHGDKAKDCYGSMGIINAELIYNSLACPENNNIQFSPVVWPGSYNIRYSYMIRTAQNCFGCVSLHNNSYCLLNKQYSESEYKKIMPKVIAHMKKTGEWGQFFPMNICPFAYNETAGQDLFPLTKEEVQATFGGRWLEQRDQEKKSVSNNIDIFLCENCHKDFKLIKQEIEFYKRQQIPFPRLCFNCRHLRRMNLRTVKDLWKRQCMCTQPTHNHYGRCTNEFETTYSPNRKELIYCVDCYNKEIY